MSTYYGINSFFIKFNFAKFNTMCCAEILETIFTLQNISLVQDRIQNQKLWSLVKSSGSSLIGAYCIHVRQKWLYPTNKVLDLPFHKPVNIHNVLSVYFINLSKSCKFKMPSSQVEFFCYCGFNKIPVYSWLLY